VVIDAVPYAGAADEWDALVVQAPMATFLHTRRFLDHHGDRFRDVSLLLIDDGEIVGVLPAAVDPTDERRIVSHPGSTYGGVVHDAGLAGEGMIEAIEAIRASYRDQGFEMLTYKAVPYIYHRSPSQDDLYALFRLEAARARVDFSCAIDLDSRRPPTKRRARGLKKARAQEIEVVSSPDVARDLWPVLEENLRDRHGLRPVHTVEEILHLHELFPDEVGFVVGVRDGEVLGGTVTFTTPRVVHAQYTAAGERGREASVLDAIFERCIEESRGSGARFFDFGISTTDNGRRLNAGLHRFKLEFGGGGVTYETYELTLPRGA
jgi:hypothetical protein